MKKTSIKGILKENIVRQNQATKSVTVPVKTTILEELESKKFSISRTKILKMAIEMGINEVIRALEKQPVETANDN